MTTNTNQVEFIAAIDIGTTKIVALVGQKLENGRIKIIGMSKTASRGVKRGVVLNIEETVNSIQTAVEAVQMKSHVMFSEVFVGIAGQHIRSIRNRGYINKDSSDHEITKADIERLVQDMHKTPIEIGEEILHVLPQSFIVDNEAGIRSPVGMSAQRLEGNFHIVIGQTAMANKIDKCVNRVGLRLNSLILQPLASSRAVLTEDEKEAGVALVDIGGGTTDVAVFYDGIVKHTAVIAFGGNVITNDIKEGCQLLLKDAEEIKVKYGSAFGDTAPANKYISIPGISGREPREITLKMLANIIQARMEEIIDAVAFEIENSGYYDKLGAGIVLTGGGALLNNLPQLVKFKTGLDVKVGYPFESMAAEIGDDVNHPMFSTSVGLLLEGYDYLKKHGEVNKTSMINNNEAKKESNGKSLIEKLRFGITNSFSGIFDDKGAEM
jgi:cell division protein FtsA